MRRDLADLYRRLVPDAVRLAYLMTGDRVLAEDLAQDAFVRLAGRFDHIRSSDAFPTYLRRTVVNLVRNHYRRQKVERAYLESEKIEPRPESPPDLAALETVRTALLLLPYRQRAAIVLRYFEDLSEQQIGELLNCRPGTVKSLVSRGLASLRASIGVEVDLP
jgi:RNA polymerase sigma-70 factor (sigma-E family)